MEQLLRWLFEKLGWFMEQMLSWKIFGDFSLLHFMIGLSFLGLLLSFFTFGENSIGGTAEYIGGIRRHNNAENRKDRERYETRIYENRIKRINNYTGELSDYSYSKATRRKK